MKKKYKKVYCIGIGGIGLSAIARYFLNQGVEVLGSDRDMDSVVIKSLPIEVFDQNIDFEIPEDIDAVVYTTAVDENNRELVEFRERGIDIFTYAEMLGEISRDKYTIAVTGTHGKTSTTSMAAHAANKLGLNPNVIVGGFITHNGEKTNYIPGDSDLFITEACEYRRSFLNLNPNVLIITNIEADHLDYYKNLDDVKSAFHELASKVPENGKIICDVNDPNLKEIVTEFGDKVLDYIEGLPLLPKLKVIGEHNRCNASAAMISLETYTGKAEDFNVMESYVGTWRRGEYIGETANGVRVYNDYGHHPTEVSKTLEAFVNEFSEKKVVVIFQPHLHSRTKEFFYEFVEALNTAHTSIIYPIYKARSEDDYGVSSEMLVEHINTKAGDSMYMDNFDDIAKFVNELDDTHICIFMGAGEVDRCIEDLDIK